MLALSTERGSAGLALGVRCSRTTGFRSSSSPRASRCESRSTGAGAPMSTLSASAPGTAPSSIRPAASSSSAPTAATPGPTARPSCSPAGASPRATARRCRGSSRAAATRSGCARTRTGSSSISTATGCRRRLARSAGPLRVDLLCDPTPAARLRAFCRLTGFPALLPEWGYGFWKSRDVYEHQDDVLDDYEGLRRHDIPVDAIVLDSPWATQYNTWEFNRYQFPDAPGADPADARRRGPDRGVGDAVGEHRLARRADPASARVRAAAPRAGVELRARARRGGVRALRVGRGFRIEPFVTQWWMGTGSPVDFTSDAAERVVARAGQAAARARRRGCQGRRRRGLLPAGGGAAARTGGPAPRRRGRSAAFIACAFSARSTRSIPGDGVLFGRSGWTGQHAVGHTWAGDQASDFWSLRVLVVATLSAACSGLLELVARRRRLSRTPPGRALPARAAAPLGPVRLLHPADACPRPDAAGALALLRARARALPRVRAAARAARAVRPGRRGDRRPDGVADHPAAVPDRSRAIRAAGRSATPTATGPRCGSRRCSTTRPASARSRCRGETGSRRGRARRCAGAVRPWWTRRSSGSRCGSAPARSSSRTRRRTWRGGWGTFPSAIAPLVATLWGVPRLGRAAARLADGTRIAWRRGRWSVSSPCEREVTFREIGG